MLAIVGAACYLSGCGGSGGMEGTETCSLHSRVLGRDLEQVVVPEGRSRPLLVFLHGRGDGPGELLGDELVDALRELGPEAPNVLFPSGGESSYWHDRRDGAWGRYVVEEAIPAALQRLHADRRRVAIGGFSMGGFGALDLARLHPGRFCAVGGHAAARGRVRQAPPRAHAALLCELVPLDDRARLYLYRRFLDTGAPPSAAQTAGALGLSAEEGAAAYRRLADEHVIVLEPGTTDVWMAAPLSARATPFLVTTAGRRYYGNCVWDGLGVAAMLGTDARIDTDCDDCGEPMVLAVRDGKLEADGVAHFAVPAAHWWDDIGFT
jgi:pimeloyl-ACP methyl ester carboxylesterase